MISRHILPFFIFKVDLEFSDHHFQWTAPPLSDLQSRPRSGGGNAWLAPFGYRAKTLLTVLTDFQLAFLAEDKRNLLVFETTLNIGHL